MTEAKTPTTGKGAPPGGPPSPPAAEKTRQPPKYFQLDGAFYKISNRGWREVLKHVGMDKDKSPLKQIVEKAGGEVVAAKVDTLDGLTKERARDLFFETVEG